MVLEGEGELKRFEVPALARYYPLNPQQKGIVASAVEKSILVRLGPEPEKFDPMGSEFYIGPLALRAVCHEPNLWMVSMEHLRGNLHVAQSAAKDAGRCEEATRIGEKIERVEAHWRSCGVCQGKIRMHGYRRLTLPPIAMTNIITRAVIRQLDQLAPKPKYL